MTEPRQDIARRVVISVLVIDAVLFLGFFVLFGRLDSSRGTPLDPLLRGLAFALPFALAAWRVKSGRGLERTLFAQVVAWGVAFLVPFTAFVFLPIGRGDLEDYILLVFCGLQLLIPAVVRWAKGNGAFLRTYGGMVAILVVAFAYAWHKM
jgi:hypothetical protein